MKVLPRTLLRAGAVAPARLVVCSAGVATAAPGLHRRILPPSRGTPSAPSRGMGGTGEHALNPFPQAGMNHFVPLITGRRRHP